MIVVSLILYGMLALIVCHVVFSRISLPELLISFFLSTFTLNIIISEILGSLDLLNNSILYFGLQILITLMLIYFLMRRFHVRWIDLLPKNNPSAQKLDFITVLLSGIAMLNLLTMFFVGIQTPPNNMDTLHTHLTRVFYWLQHGNFQTWPTMSTAQLYYPINANVQALWLFLLGHNENLFFLVSWFSLVIITVGVYKIARELNLNRHEALVGCVVLLTVPAALLQAYSFQNDLTVTAFIVVFIALFLTYRRTKNAIHLIFSMLSLALSLGVKQTAFMVLPAIFLWLLYSILTHKIKKEHLSHLSLLFVFFVVFSSYKYVQNIAEFGSFFGTNDITAGQTFSIGGILSKAKYNIPRYLYNSLSVDGVSPSLAVKLTCLKAGIFRSVTTPLHLNLEDEVFLQPGYDPSERFTYTTIAPLAEDTAWFGPLSIVLVITSFFVILLQKDKHRKEYLLFSLILSLSYFISILLQRPGWDPYQGRYFILAITPALPLIGVCLPKQKLMKATSVTLLVIVYCYLAFSILFLNISKPIFTARTISNWQNSYVLKLPFETKIQKYLKNYLIKYTNQLMVILPQRESILNSSYYDQLFYSTTGDIVEMELVNETIDPTQPLYLMISQSALEYGLFGVNQTRELTRINDTKDIPVNGYLFIENKYYADIHDFRLIKSDEKFSIYRRVK